MAISGKVTASTVAASVTTVVSGILAPHVFWRSVPSDVRGLVEAGVTAVVTFGAGYLARHGVDAGKLAEDAEAVAADLGVPFMALSDAPETLADVVADPAATDPAPAAPLV
jgi:hypothetical protein